MQENGTPQRHDIKIMGNGGSAGGLVGRLSITGDGEIHGDVDAISFKCTGNATVNGSLKAETLKLTGDLILRGSLEGKVFSTMGKLQIQEHVTARKIKFSGDTHVGGQITSEQIELSGYNTVEGGCQAEEFKARGAVRIGGMLNSENVEIKLLGESRIKEIGGGLIRVMPSRGLWALVDMFNPEGPPRLVATSIEGDTINLENTEAEYVRGNKVTIGPGCRIGLVEYIEAFHQDRSSSVEQLSQVSHLN
ncbi:hypothetical protein [Paenibacillus tuaregi]|uniref:hypothetical protein n=1 Tax=Paenibacillus tuaregi TaxID=1816681 RepID=UPI000838DBD9|nr:hypothetical protein [Paenibacillus tuaregi]